MRKVTRFGRAARPSLVVPAVVCALIVVSVAAAGSYTAGPLSLASGPSPFAGCTTGGNPTSTNYANTEVEPFVAVNPTNPNNVVAVFQQDRWSDGGAHGLVAAVSPQRRRDLERTWAHFSLCSGGTVANGGDFDRASDPVGDVRSERRRLPDQPVGERRSAYLGDPRQQVDGRRRHLE